MDESVVTGLDERAVPQRYRTLPDPIAAEHLVTTQDTSYLVTSPGWGWFGRPDLAGPGDANGGPDGDGD